MYIGIDKNDLQDVSTHVHNVNFTFSTLRYNIARPFKDPIYYMFFWAEGNPEEGVPDQERVIVVGMKLRELYKKNAIRNIRVIEAIGEPRDICVEMSYTTDLQFAECFWSFKDFETWLSKNFK